MEKVAIISGGTKGIGLGIAHKFVNSGYKVSLSYRSDERAAKQALASLDSDKAIAIRSDVSNQEDRQELLDKTRDAFGGCQVLINNAGFILGGKFLSIPHKDFESIMNTNFYGAVYLAQLFANQLVDNSQEGSIVNICSMGAYMPGDISYCSSKAALVFATRCMARELSKHKIRVNSVSPGAVATDLNSWSRENGGEQWTKMINKTPMKRAGTPQEIAAAVYFLASPDASFITGRDLVVDGGFIG